MANIFVWRDRVLYSVSSDRTEVVAASDWPSHLSVDEIIIEAALTDHGKLPLTAADFDRIKRKPRYVNK